ncbi:hypothetical protein [Falsirhodobacter halotolerans]|uniref:hypothetical protein n=1 Tax=Falsirhodobacter halotolerans TaxID=1146892 RepID=UPI001FD5942D|nr:hypothetical protein [Falsirhodobacter halotolerans]MCJ8140231.1 hypothetical protein [Falsirhodobacter halotolerans]
MERIVLGCGAVLSEGGGTLLASALGGLTRWIATDRRHLRDAGMAVAGGVLAGHYLWPIILWTLGMTESPHSMTMAAFVAGTLGMSGVRLIVALVETRARRMGDA